MKSTIWFLLFCFISLQAAEESSFEWVYNSDKSCSAYLEKSNTKDREISWTGECINKKINGYGILLITGKKDTKREKLINYKGLAHDGILDGNVFIQFYNKYKIKGSITVENDNPKPNSTAYYIYPEHNFIEKELFLSPNSQKQSIEKSKNPEEYNKMEELVYKHDKLFKNNLSTCENELHNFKLSFYENKIDGNPSYNSVVSDIRDLFKCQIQNKQYKNVVDTANDFLSKVNDEEKKQFNARLAEIVGIGYYYLKDYQKSFDYFSKTKDFLYFEESKTILESNEIQSISKDKSKELINKMILGEITEAIFNLNFSDDEKIIQDIINKTKQRIDINTKDSDGETILTNLASINKPIIIEKLIKAGADVNIPNNNGITALMKAVNSENMDLIKIFVQNKANINVESNIGVNALVFALWIKDENKRYDILKYLLENGGNANFKYEKYADRKGAEYYTLLHRITSSSNDPKLIKLLIDNGANVNIKFIDQNNINITPLDFAIKKLSSSEALNQKAIALEEMSKTVNKILGMVGQSTEDRNYDKEIKELKGKKFEYRYPSYDTVKLLLDSGVILDKNKFYLDSIEDLNLIKLLIKFGANVNGTDNDGRTALFFQKKYEIIKLLVDSGANVNIKDIYNETALMHHIDFNKNPDIEKIFKLLIKSGIDVNTISKRHGYSVISKCYDNYEQTKLLIEAGANLTYIDTYKMTPLKWCEQYSKDKRVCQLIQDSLNK